MWWCSWPTSCSSDAVVVCRCSELKRSKSCKNAFLSTWWRACSGPPPTPPAPRPPRTRPRWSTSLARRRRRAREGDKEVQRSVRYSPLPPCRLHKPGCRRWPGIRGPPGVSRASTPRALLSRLPPHGPTSQPSTPRALLSRLPPHGPTNQPVGKQQRTKGHPAGRQAPNSSGKNKEAQQTCFQNQKNTAC